MTRDTFLTMLQYADKIKPNSIFTIKTNIKIGGDAVETYTTIVPDGYRYNELGEKVFNDIITEIHPKDDFVQFIIKEHRKDIDAETDNVYKIIENHALIPYENIVGIYVK